MISPAGGSGTACPGETVVLDAAGSAVTSCPGTVTYGWTRNGVVVPGATFPLATVQELSPGSYDWAVTVTCAPPPTGLACASTSAPFTVTYATSGSTPLDRGNTLVAVKSAADVVLSWVRPADGSLLDDLLRGTTKVELLPPGPPAVQAGLPGPLASDAGGAADAGTYYYRVRGVNCGTPGPY